MAGLVEGLAEATEDSSSFSGGYSYCFVDGDPPNKYICHICTLPARDPHQVTCCYNIYCSVCLQTLKLLKVKGQNGFICPTCRQPLEGNYFKDGRVDREIRCLEVYCNNRMEKGCPWVGTVANIESHLTVCPFDVVKCSNGCGAELKRSNLKTHLTSRCSQRIVKCQYCQSSGMHIIVTSKHHLDTCTHYPVKCANKDCSLELPRIEMLSHIKACAKTLVSCEYSSIGCDKKIMRENLEKHNEESMKDHLLMAVKEVGLLRADVKMLKEKTILIDSFRGAFASMASIESVHNLATRVISFQGQSKSIQAQVTNLQAKVTRDQEERTIMQRTVQSIRGQTANLKLVQTQHCKAIESLTANVSAQQIKNKVHKHVFKLSGFTDKRDSKKAWYSPTFYTSPGGYMMALRVDVSGDASNESFIGCYVCLMAGEYDHALEWPFSGVATIELLNQLEDKNHKTYELVFDNALPQPCRERVYGKTNTLGWGFSEFIAHSELAISSTSFQYLCDDKLYFRVTVNVTSKTKPWLEETDN
ncbi:PREDICTED: TNF receptor-associated factor 2-like [Amphimedon queenslandica]|uniref:RING-type E3 ubiquitin transferase n=1 Tax=Amphimedon queenslandica TaxID=400682 RepID=A0A1X7UUW5_AMPQE|nr:PREDICTED: TNF receptor-associated factor 2-like [Amphimedon queenslandica]|eukprot:XP_011404109.1 PREDICTED: TNF receptor-associated factor 2-like [Amphimedon queenslandica]